MSLPPPVTSYPNTAVVQPQQPPRRHSDGSFGSVFIVLAVIVVISGIACFLGRLCNRKMNRQKPGPKVKPAPPASHGPKPRDREPPEFNFRHKPTDPEFGFRPSKEPEFDFRPAKGPEFNFRPKERGGPEFNFRPMERDLELGLEKGIPAGKKNGVNRGTKPLPNGEFKGNRKPVFYDEGPRGASS